MAAVQIIVAEVAVEALPELVAGEDERLGARLVERVQGFDADALRQRVGAEDEGGIVTLVVGLDDRVAGIVDVITVVAGKASQDVGGGIAGQRIVERRTGQISIPVSVSTPAPSVSWAPAAARLTVTPDAAPA